MKTYEIKKVYYSIGEVCKEIGILPSTIKHWEKICPQLAPARRHGKGRTFGGKAPRVYTIKEFENLKRFHYLRTVKDFGIKGAYAQIQDEKK